MLDIYMTMMKNYNSISTQKRMWGNAMKGFTPKEGEKFYGYAYGNPDSEQAKDASGAILGNYKKIKDNFVLSNIDENSVFLEIGSLGGKWTRHFLGPGRVICADIVEEGFHFIDTHLNEKKNIEFCLISGYDLKEIEDNSVDFIFSMDSLVRSEKEIIQDYILEFKRVLKENGKVCVHLPCSNMQNSKARGFTDISEQEIAKFCTQSGFADFHIDKNIIAHGIILKINYGHKL